MVQQAQCLGREFRPNYYQKRVMSYKVGRLDIKLVVISQEIIENGKIQGKSWFLEICQGVLKKKINQINGKQRMETKLF